MTSLASIIIPTFNRCHLIGETLDSILNQTYTNWECIVVDDGSTDNTKSLLKSYVNNDSRFHFLLRPNNRSKGANSCRNYGFEHCKGEFIQWFDSDDIMLPEFLDTKMELLKNSTYDYLITLTEDFEHPNINDNLGVNKKYYTFDSFEITHFNYCTQKVNWLTPDLFLKRKIANQFKYNEKLPSGQEFNFNCKLTALTENALLKEVVLTKRRMHSDSVKGKLIQDTRKYLKERGIIYYQNWLDLKCLGTVHTKETVPYFFNQTLNVSINMDVSIPFGRILSVSLEFLKKRQIKIFLLYLTYQFSGRVFKKGYLLRKMFLKSLGK
jgi:glycosyltransferase involved in cell wall biosynthesis